MAREVRKQTTPPSPQTRSVKKSSSIGSIGSILSASDSIGSLVVPAAAVDVEVEMVEPEMAASEAKAVAIVAAAEGSAVNGSGVESGAIEGGVLSCAPARDTIGAETAETCAL